MDAIAYDQRAAGITPEANAQRALAALRAAYPSEADVTVETLGDVAYEQVADVITDLLQLVDLAGEDVGAVLRSALGNFLAERDDAPGALALWEAHEQL